MAIKQCEMIQLNISRKKCSERTSIIKDWCYVCRIRGDIMGAGIVAFSKKKKKEEE